MCCSGLAFQDAIQACAEIWGCRPGENGLCAGGKGGGAYVQPCFDVCGVSVCFCSWVGFGYASAG